MNDWIEHVAISLGNLTSDFIKALETRAALLSEEWRLERRRSIVGVALACLGAGSCFLAILGFMAAYVLSLPEGERIEALLTVSWVLLAGGLLVIGLVWWLIARVRPFQQSIEEFKKDSRCVREIAARRHR